jgi:DNA-directed RNA polymerase specialized sigma subunit
MAYRNKDKDIELWKAYKANPGPMTLEPLMKQLDPLLQAEVNRWSGALARQVLESKARKLALEAIKSYNPNMGAALGTHVVNRLKKLSRSVYTHQDAVRIPEYKKLKVHSYLRGQSELMDQFGRDPTNQELSDHLGWAPKTVSDVQRTMRPELIQSEDVGGGMFERQSVWGSDSEDGMVDMIYYDLDPIDKLIFEHSTGYSGKPVLNNTELMRKTGLTQGQLSYRKRKIVDKIKHLMP